jgi:hypothetical protein
MFEPSGWKLQPSGYKENSAWLKPSFAGFGVDLRKRPFQTKWFELPTTWFEDFLT